MVILILSILFVLSIVFYIFTPDLNELSLLDEKGKRVTINTKHIVYYEMYKVSDNKSRLIIYLVTSNKVIVPSPLAYEVLNDLKLLNKNIIIRKGVLLWSSISQAIKKIHK